MSAALQAKPKILVVDDMDINRLILQEILQDSYDVEMAENGSQAVTLMLDAVEKPKLVLLDVIMP